MSDASTLAALAPRLAEAEQPETPLTVAEQARLGAFLASLPPGAMSLEMLDGFVCALTCAPEPLPPSVWLPVVWGETAQAQASFENAEEARDLVGLVLRHGVVVTQHLARATEATEPQLYRPWIAADGLGNDWAAGFMRGVQVSSCAEWQTLFDDPEAGSLLVPMMMLYHEHDADPEMRSPEISAAERPDVLADMVVALHQIYAYFAASRRAAVRAEREALTFRRSQAKVGRNEVCPCGSGRKFKRCCALASGGAVEAASPGTAP